MKVTIKDKKRLQKERNVLTAQLSRDRKKLEIEMLRKYCVEATLLLNLARNQVQKNPSSNSDFSFLFNGSCDVSTPDLGASSTSHEHSCQSSTGQKPKSLEYTHQESTLIKRIGKQELTRVTVGSTNKVPKRDGKLLSKRQREPSQGRGGYKQTVGFGFQPLGGERELVAAQQSSEPSNPGFNFVSVFGNSKLAKAAVSVGSVLAVSMAYMGFQQPTDQMMPLESSTMSESDMIASLNHDRSNFRWLQSVEAPLTKSKIVDNNSSQGDLFAVKQTSWGLLKEKILEKPEDETAIIKYYDDGAKEYPCDKFNSKKFLEQTYMLENMREQWVYKEIQKACASDMFGEVTEDKPKKQITVYNPTSKGLKTLNQESVIHQQHLCSNSADVKTQFNEINDKTTTIYSGKPQMILPQDTQGNMIPLELNSEGDSQYLHIVLPTSELNILNANGQHQPGGVINNTDDMFVEIGCKIFEINHIVKPETTII